jgi:hypothetical protein
MLATEMNGVAASEVFERERGNRDRIGLQFIERLAQSGEVGAVRKESEICISAKLGRAVKHARLSAHKQGVNALLAHRRKDFEYRVRDQVNLPVRDRFATTSRSPANVVQGSAGTSPPIPRQPVVPAESLLNSAQFRPVCKPSNPGVRIAGIGIGARKAVSRGWISAM